MEIEDALKITGFKLCGFKGDDDIECESCGDVIPIGKNVYYERACYDVDEGEYHCEECVIGKPAEWDAYGKHIESMIENNELII